MVVQGYGNIKLKMNDLQDNTNILTVINVSWTPKLGHNLLSTIPLAKNSIEVFLRKIVSLQRLLLITRYLV